MLRPLHLANSSLNFLVGYKIFTWYQSKTYFISHYKKFATHTHDDRPNKKANDIDGPKRHKYNLFFFEWRRKDIISLYLCMKWVII